TTPAPNGGGPTSTTAAPPTQATTTTVAPTTTQAPQAPTWAQFANASIPAVCAKPPTKLVDGKNVTLTEQQGIYQLEQTLGAGNTSGIAQGLPSDAGPLTAVVVNCNAGGVGWPNDIAAFGPGGVFYDETSLNGHVTGDSFDTMRQVDEAGPLWQASGLMEPARGGVDSIRIDGNALVVSTLALNQGEAECCATGHAIIRISAHGHQLHIDSVTNSAGH
ncbi:MAG: hypothetical protein JST73_02855, partial [Actinobacteria bacterium]|nr:hypothetical protein [Actinomycetota bacterium]